MSEKYNVWSFILHKITCGKYEYIEVDYKGFISPDENGDRKANLIKGDDEEINVVKGNEETNMTKGNEEINMSKGNEEANMSKGNEETNFTKSDKKDSIIKGNEEDNMVKGDIINDVCYDNE